MIPSEVKTWWQETTEGFLDEWMADLKKRLGGNVDGVRNSWNEESRWEVMVAWIKDVEIEKWTWKEDYKDKT